MKERPILMNGEMVRAILAGRKTQTRRLVRLTGAECIEVRVDSDHDDGAMWPWSPQHEAWIASPLGDVGDRLWVRETWHDDFGGADMPRLRNSDGDPDGVLYRADHNCKSFEAGCPCNPDGDGKRSEWRPSIHMPRWASRITLEVTNVRVERVTDISEADAMAEGVESAATKFGSMSDEQTFAGGTCRGETKGSHPHKLAFACLWDEIYGDTAPWVKRPWVWAVTFKRVEADNHPLDAYRDREVQQQDRVPPGARASVSGPRDRPVERRGQGQEELDRRRDPACEGEQ